MPRSPAIFASRHANLVRFALLSGVLASAAGCGDESAATAMASSKKDLSTSEAASLPETVELGEITLAQLRPLENSTMHIRFHAHATASADHATRLEKTLGTHRHQAREQIIVAVRAAETWEFDEPDLRKLRRRIVLGLNRWLDERLVEDVVLTDFRFRVD